MKKNIITIINIVSAIPILAYPLIFIAGAMFFDAPGSNYSISAWIGFLLSISYPAFIIGFIVFSRKKNSTSLALVGLIPLLFLLYIFLIAGGTDQKNNYETLNKDFICNSNSFISIDDSDGMDLLEKKNFFTYKNEPFAIIDNNKQLSLMPWLKNSKETQDLLSNCKNKEGKSLLDLYTLSSN